MPIPARADPSSLEFVNMLARNGEDMAGTDVQLAAVNLGYAICGLPARIFRGLSLMGRSSARRAAGWGRSIGVARVRYRLFETPHHPARERRNSRCDNACRFAKNWPSTHGDPGRLRCRGTVKDMPGQGSRRIDLAIVRRGNTSAHRRRCAHGCQVPLIGVLPTQIRNAHQSAKRTRSATQLRPCSHASRLTISGRLRRPWPSVAGERRGGSADARARQRGHDAGSVRRPV